MPRPAVADYPPGARLPSRVIDDFEFVWMLRGRARFRYAGHDIPLLPGHLLLVPPGLEHEFVWDPTRPARHGYVHFERPAHAGEVRLATMTANDPLAGLCAYLLWLNEDQAIEETLDFMLARLQGPLPAPEPKLPAPLKAAIAYLSEEWATMPLRRISVTELAAQAHVSRGYLNRLFATTFGASVAAALESVRCARAETLLTRTDLTIDTIARQCGFADLSHFSHRFTAVHGIPPSVYRSAGTTSVLDRPGIRRFGQLLTDPHTQP